MQLDKQEMLLFLGGKAIEELVQRIGGERVGELKPSGLQILGSSDALWNDCSLPRTCSEIVPPAPDGFPVVFECCEEIPFVRSSTCS